MPLFQKSIFGPIVGVLIAMALGGLFRILCVTEVENYELGYQFDATTGETTVLDRTGYFVHYPLLVRMYTIDLRPHQVCMNANQRVLNCKLVRFNPDGLEDFLAKHGNGDYDYDSGGLGGQQRVGNDGKLGEILKSYAMDGSGVTPPFLIVEVSLDKGSSSQNAARGGAVVPQ